MYLADAFIQRDLQCIQVIHFNQYVCSLGIKPTTFGAVNAVLYHSWTIDQIRQIGQVLTVVISIRLTVQ